MDTIRHPVDFIGFALSMDNLGLIQVSEYRNKVKVSMIVEKTVLFLI